MAENSWRPSRKKYGVAIYNYSGGAKGRLRLHVGETVHIQEEYWLVGGGGWYRGVSLQNKGKKGIFPASYVHIKDCEVDNEGRYETITPVEDPMVKELTYVLREWWTKWHKLFVHKGRCKDFLDIEKMMHDLISQRGKLVSAALSHEQAKDLRQDIATLIDWGDGKLGMDLVPRVDGEQVDPDRCSVVGLYRIHIKSAENTHTDAPRKKTPSFETSNRGSGELKGLGLQHILANFHSSQCNMGDEGQIYMSVYNAKENKFISEQFEISLNRNGLHQNTEKLNSCYGLFSDLSSEDFEKNLYIVAKIYRCGKMLVAKDQKGTTRVYKRPFGVGVLKVEEIKHMATTDDAYETMIKVQSCTDNENSFPDLHETLIRKMTSAARPGGSIREEKVVLGITFSFRVFVGDLQLVKTEHAILFSKGVTVVPKLSFADLIINPGALRNDIYLTLVSAEFDRGRKKSEKNVEVQVTVFDSEGTIIPNCLQFGCGENPQSSFYSTIYYHNNNPKWNETVKVSLPMDKLPKSRVRFDIFHCSTRGRSDKKLHSFAFLKVTDESNIVIQDASHDLCLYQCDDIPKIQFKKYKDLPYLFDDFNDTRMSVYVQGPGNLPYKKSRQERLTIKTQLCSTKYTQTRDLLGLLQWKQNKQRLSNNLECLMKLDGVEIMKFLPDVLDSLFTMLSDKFVKGEESPGANSLLPKVFQVLVYVLNLLQDSRFVTFLPVLENYLTEVFASPVVHRDMLQCFTDRILDYVNGGSFTVSMALKVLDQIMRFIVRSRNLQLSSIYQQQGSEKDFRHNLHELFCSFGKLLAQRNDRLRISQMALLSNLHKVYVPLSKVMNLKDLADEVQSVVMGMPKSNSLAEDVQRNKLDFIKETVNSDLFQADESRGIILPLCLGQIKTCMIEKNMLPQATCILGDILNSLFTMKQKMSMQKDINMMVLSIFDVILETVQMLSDRAFLSIQALPAVETIPPKANSNARKTRIIPFRSPSNVSENEQKRTKEKLKNPRPKTDTFPHKWKGELIACLTDMLRLMDDQHYDSVMRMFPEHPLLKHFLTKVFITFRELIKPEIFPKHWTVMRLVTNNVIFTAVEYFSNALTEHFLHSEAFDGQLWQHYFNLSVAFITQPSLQLEKFSEAKRQKTKERYQDMRVLMGQQVQVHWENLGINQRHFIPSLIGPFLKMTLVPQRELRSATLPIFYDMMKCEQRLSGHFQMVENEIIEKLDIFITTTTESLGDLEYQELFKKILLERVQSEPTLQENGSQFILSVTSLLERLLDYRQAYDGDDSQDRRMQCTFNILNFYKRDKNNRQEMYIRYIKKLYDLQVSARHYVEAGLTLQLYAQLLHWGDDIKQEDMGFQAQPEWERKEKLYLQVIDCFDKGKVWEYGIPLCKELAKFYEDRLEYRKLSAILQRQAAFFGKILDGVEVLEEGSDQPTFYPRQDPTYFRVAYYGKNFPPFVRNKAFIYRGDECLKLQDIINQLTQEFPQAQIMRTNSPPDSRIKEGDGLYIQICSVKPIASERPEIKRNPNAPPEIRNFYSSNDIDTFQFDRSFHRGEKDHNNEFKTLCTERTVMKTNYKFPGILQWYEVVSMDTQVLNPVCTAIEAIKQKIKELKTVISVCQRNFTTDNVKHLSMLLNGMISANVQGGLPKYQEAFLSNDFAMLHPEESRHLPELQQSIKEQVLLLDRGVKQMKKSGHRDLDAMTRNLEKTLEEIKHSLEEKDPNMFVKKRKDSGMGSQNQIDITRDSTPSVNSLHSSSSNHSSEVSLENVSTEEGVYTDLDQDDYHPYHLANSVLPPPPAEKRRHSQHFPFVGASSPGQHYPTGSPRQTCPPPIPSRPHSLCLNGLAAQQVSSQIGAPRSGSDTNVKDLTDGVSEYVHPSGPPTPCKTTPSPGGIPPYVKPTSPPMPVIPGARGQGHRSFSTPSRTPPPIPRKASLPVSSDKHMSKIGEVPALPEKKRKQSETDTVPPLPPRESMIASSHSSSVSSLNGGTEYKQLEVVSSSSLPPPIPERRRDSSISSTPPKVSPRSSQASTSSSSLSEDTQL